MTPEHRKVLFVTGASTGIGAALTARATLPHLLLVGAVAGRVTVTQPSSVEMPVWAPGRTPEGAAFLHEDSVAGAVMYAMSQPCTSP